MSQQYRVVWKRQGRDEQWKMRKSLEGAVEKLRRITLVPRSDLPRLEYARTEVRDVGEWRLAVAVTTPEDAP